MCIRDRFYWLAPKFWGRELWSKNLANFHFWIGLVGILLYVSSLWFAGIIQGLMLNETDATGTRLVNEFGQTVDKIQSLMLLRAIGGTFYLIGFVLLVINIWKTAQSGSPVNETREVYEDQSLEKDRMAWGAVFRNDPITYLFWGLFFGILWFFLPPGASHMALLCALGFAYLGVKRFRADSASWASWYDDLSENFVPFTVLVIIAVAIGGIVQIVPVITVNRAANVEDRLQKLYTPLELEGRDLYVSEGCYNCHSQMIRMLVPDVLRYGDYSRLGESIYDHPFQWGSKRTGPDLAREGTLRGDDWHYLHLLAPRSISGGSRMPNYPWLFEKETNFSSLPGKIAVQQRIGVPYPIMTPAEIEQGAREQALEIATRLVEKKVRIPERKDGANPTTPVEARDYLAGRQAIALIAYLQKLGSFDVVVTDPKAPEKLPSGILPGIPDAQRVGKPGTDTQQPKD